MRSEFPNLPGDVRGDKGDGGQQHIAGLDGLRGFAALAVTLYHFGVFGFRSGYLGVDIFFILSGYVVTRSMLRRPRDPGWVADFYARRVRRLMPAIAAVAVFVAVVSLFDSPLVDDQGGPIIGALAQVYNVGVAVNDLSGYYLAHFWSLSVEFQFYLVMPLLVVALTRFPHRARARMLLMAAAAVMGLRLLALLAGLSTVSVYVLTIFRADGLLIGMALAYLGTSWIRALPKAIPAVAALLLVALVVLTPNFFAHPTLVLGFVVPATYLLSAVLLAGVAEGVALQGLLANRYVVALGHRSYSLYLWHYVIGVSLLAGGVDKFVSVPVLLAQIALSFAAAEISYRFIEFAATKRPTAAPLPVG